MNSGLLQKATQLARSTRTLSNLLAQTSTPTSRLFASGSATANSEHPFDKESLEEIRARIFGNRIGTGLRSGAKLLRKKLLGEKLTDYYKEPIAKYDPMMIDEKDEARKIKLEKLKRRGKGPPKKGQGKRATKGKKK